MHMMVQGLGHVPSATFIMHCHLLYLPDPGDCETCTPLVSYVKVPMSELGIWHSMPYNMSMSNGMTALCCTWLQ